MSKLKTVFDAVNELRGDLNNAARADTQTYLKFSLVTHTWLCSASSITNHSYEDVCTIAEFNALVKEMTLGLDVNPINLGHYLNYVNAYKTLLKKESEVDYTSEEFWKDAPEGATHYWSWSQSFYKFSDYDEDFVFNNDSWELCSDISCFGSDGLFEYPQSTPTETPEEKEALDSIVNKPLVYTKEMVDNGELPSVGMECMYDNNLVNILAISSCDELVFESLNGYVGLVLNKKLLAPIDTRTDKEKAIDALMEKSVVFCNNEIMSSCFSIAFDEWVGE